MFPPWIVRVSEWEGEELSRVGRQKEDERRTEMMRCKSEPVFVNLLRAQKSIPNMAESLPRLLKRLQIRVQDVAMETRIVNEYQDFFFR